MSEEERRTGYNTQRILIDAIRILEPSFYPQGIYLSGAQVELLRNVTAYLGRRSTFVDEYHGAYYLMPDDTDWSAIEAIVADLEEKLSNNDNVPFGFTERWVDVLESLLVGDGTQTITLNPVNSGEILRLEAISWYNNTGVRGRMQIFVKTGTQTTMLATIQTPAIKEPAMWSGVLSLAEGDLIVVKQFSCLDSDIHLGAARGYMMQVPD